MKGQMPIVIAMVIVFAVVFSSLYFITTVNIGASTTDMPYSTIYWLRIQEELDNLAYIALKYGSQEADRVFIQVYNQLAQEAESLSDLEQAVEIASSQADQAMKEKVYEIIGNWTLLKEKEGFTIRFKELSATYYVGYGRGYSNVFFHVQIVSYTGEYREFIENYTVFYGLSLEKTNIDLLSIILDLLNMLGLDFVPGVNLTLVFDAVAYIDMNGEKYYFMLDKDSASAVVRNFIDLLIIVFDLGSVYYVPAGMYYYGQGHTRIVYYIDATTAIAGLLQILFAGDVVGVTSSINIDGFVARTAIKLT